MNAVCQGEHRMSVLRGMALYHPIVIMVVGLTGRYHPGEVDRVDGWNAPFRRPS